jgi:ribosome-associated protein
MKATFDIGLIWDSLVHELSFNTSRSSGPGGQNVNKVNTKVELRLNVEKTELFTAEQKKLLIEKLKAKINTEGDLIIVSQETRSQMKNKAIALEKLHEILQEVFKVEKERKPTKPNQTKKEKRLKEKRIVSSKKERRKLFFDDPE